MLRTMPRAKLEDDLAAAEALAARPAATAAELADNLAQMYSAIYNVSLDRYDVSALARSAPQLINTLFEHRLRLREQVADWHARGFMSLPAQRAVRNALRIARYATDMLGELNIGYTQLGPHEKTMRGFRGTDLNTLLNPAFATGRDLPFEAGRSSSDARHAPQQRGHRPHRRRRTRSSATCASFTPTRPASSGWSRP